ncbi:granulocyte colony-stimulating factor receptor [Elgaria multicarinata webbii]|uniref:granulocyte colony-stimulating factor receptor n=1 Tax=Elgaria multicarinata webbii TaxID=159646 RepID=UPI002FCCC5C9
MATTKTPWRELLGCSLFLLLLPGANALSCSHLAVDSKFVVLGATASASCTIWKNHCPFHKDKEIQIMWKLDEEFLRGAQYSLSNGVEVSNITVGPLNETWTTLSCFVQRESGSPQFMNQVQIQAGYPPSQPQNLTCTVNASSVNLTCHWDPGQDTLLPVIFALKGFWTRRECEGPLVPIPDCSPSAGQNSCVIGRQYLRLYQKMLFLVSAKNVLGAVESERLCADPADLVQLDPPSLLAVHSVPEETDCVSVAWQAAKGDVYQQQLCDLRYRREGDRDWAFVRNISSPTWQVQHCGFLFSTPYQFQMRCRKLPVSYWSDWSPAKNFTTHEKAPSGKLHTWWKMKPGKAERETEVQLLWKPMQSNETHGKILGYWAAHSSSPPKGKPGALCNTTELQCTFSVPSGTRRIYLAAYNSRGASDPNEVLLLEAKGLSVATIQASPRNEKSISIWWDPPSAAATGYVLEWHRVTSGASLEDDDDIAWTMLQNGNTTQAQIQEDIEPFQRYNFSIYPLYRDQLGAPRSVETYTRQKAPSESPKLHPGSVGKAAAELRWEPIPVEKRNGFITNYTIFWIGTNESMKSAVVNSSVNTFTITHLWPSRTYNVHVMASTVGGSTNGSILTLHTKAMDDMDILFVYLLIGLLLAMIIVLVICFQKSKRMKTQFWPSVPDPANSSLGRWAPAVLQEETLPAPKACELSPVVVSAILVLETDEKKKCLSCGKNESMKALEDRPTASSESFVPDADGAVPASGPTPASYMNGTESVQYAKVLGDRYRSQQETSPTFYVRSNSTQPLLGDMTPSPKPYENLWFHSDQPVTKRGCSFQEDALFLDRALLDFPLLQGLKIDGDEDLSHFRRL